MWVSPPKGYPHWSCKADTSNRSYRLNIEIVRYGFDFLVRHDDEERSKLSSPYSSFTIRIIIRVFNPPSHAHNTSFSWPHWHDCADCMQVAGADMPVSAISLPSIHECRLYMETDGAAALSRQVSI